MLVSNDFENMVLNGNKGTIIDAISHQLSIHANVAVSSKECEEQIKNAEKNDTDDSCVIFKTTSFILILFYSMATKTKHSTACLIPPKVLKGHFIYIYIYFFFF